MLTTTKRTIATLTAAACLGGAGWAIAGNSQGGGTASQSGSATSAATASSVPVATQTPAAPSAGGAPQGQQGRPAGPPPGGGQRPDEKLLTGDQAAKAKAAALAKLPGATVDRVETDADGGGVYEAHVTKADGSRATVLFNKDFNVTSVLDR